MTLGESNTMIQKLSAGLMRAALGRTRAVFWGIVQQTRSLCLGLLLLSLAAKMFSGCAIPALQAAQSAFPDSQGGCCLDWWSWRIGIQCHQSKRLGPRQPARMRRSIRSSDMHLPGRRHHHSAHTDHDFQSVPDHRGPIGPRRRHLDTRHIPSIVLAKRNIRDKYRKS